MIPDLLTNVNVFNLDVNCYHWNEKKRQTALSTPLNINILQSVATIRPNKVFLIAWQKSCVVETLQYIKVLWEQLKQCDGFFIPLILIFFWRSTHMPTLFQIDIWMKHSTMMLGCCEWFAHSCSLLCTINFSQILLRHSQFTHLVQESPRSAVYSLFSACFPGLCLCTCAQKHTEPHSLQTQ